MCVIKSKQLTGCSPEEHWRRLMEKTSLSLAAGAFSVVFLNFIIGLAILSLGGTLVESLFIAAVAGASFITFWVARQEDIHLSAIIWIVSTLIVFILVCLYVAAAFYDISWDGMAYHQEAIIHLAEGWNPFYQGLDDKVAHAVWIRHYPKAAWIFSAASYLVTGDIESGKAYQLLLGWAAFLLVFSAALRIRQLSIPFALLISIVAVTNPVAIYQSLGFYVDGAMSSLLTAMVALSVLILFRPSVFFAVFLGAIGILAINLKFTGIPYFSIIGIGLLGIAAMSKNFMAARLAIFSIVGGVILGAAVIGYDPYVTNTITHGHPFFPLRGENAIDIMSHVTPRPLLHMGRIEKLAFSLFHESSNDLNPTSNLKFPLTLASREIGAFTGSETRLGGWGPLFGGILILGIVAFIGLLALHKQRQVGWLTSAAVTVLIASVVLNPEAWWARYTPQLWLVPLVLSVALLSHRTKPARIAGLAIGLLMLVNSSLVAKAYFQSNYRTSGRIYTEISRLARSAQPIIVNFGPFPALRARLERANVPFMMVNSSKELVCANPTFLHGTMEQTAYCAN